MNKYFNKNHNWLFDLDNTLYPSHLNLFDQIDKKMKSFISKTLDISEEQAFIIQKKYYVKYGTTLRGLMINYNIDPDSFLSYVHNINIKKLNSNHDLNRELSKILGKKIVFTNGSLSHAERILKRLSIRNNIDGIFDIKMSNYLPKPDKTPYLDVIEKYNINPISTIMIDDIPANLKTAKKLGIKTVLIDNRNKNKLAIQLNNKYPFVDIQINNLTQFINIINTQEI